MVIGTLALYLVDISNANDIVQVLIGAVVESRFPCWVLVLAINITVVIAFWNADNHSLTGPVEQYTVVIYLGYMNSFWSQLISGWLFQSASASFPQV